jgi:DNA-binding response OmpR family regulator
MRLKRGFMTLRMAKVPSSKTTCPPATSCKGWIESARPGITVDQWFNRDDAEAAIARERYDLVVLDIELGRERHAGVAIINAINKQRQGTPVLVVSAMPAAIYRSIMKALDAWDYLQKATFEEADFIETFLDILRSAKPGPQQGAATGGQELQLDPLRQRTPIWRGQRINLPLTAQRILAALLRGAARWSAMTTCSRSSRAAATATTSASTSAPSATPSRNRPDVRRHRERPDARLPLG